MKVLKELTGYSGSTILLLQEYDQLIVRKINNIERNIKQLSILKDLNINQPKILKISNDYFDMNYIPSQNMITWLSNNPVDRFIDWILKVIDELKQNSIDYCWSEVYNTELYSNKLKPFWHNLNFTPDQLIEKLPKILPKSFYHGDLTLDNCIFGDDGKFYLIDPITANYAGWQFDIAKLQQDLLSGWFIRDKNIKFQKKLLDINDAINSKYLLSNNADLLILMLLRILPYAKNTQDQEFLYKGIKDLWK